MVSTALPGPPLPLQCPCPPTHSHHWPASLRAITTHSAFLTLTSPPSRALGVSTHYPIAYLKPPHPDWTILGRQHLLQEVFLALYSAHLPLAGLRVLSAFSASPSLFLASLYGILITQLLSLPNPSSMYLIFSL